MVSDSGAALKHRSRRWRDWEAYALVFGSSLCTLVLELVAGRLLAPTIGVSLFTWTSVIGVVLAGVAVGNYLGGRVARRSASPRVLAGVLIASSLVTWGDALLVHAMDLDALFSSLTPLTRIITLVSALFFLPSALLGAVTPLVVQLTLHDRAEAGAVVGRLGAISTAGSIAGTFLTGFWLIPTFGTRAILGGVPAALLTLAVLALWGRASAPKAGEATFLVTMLALAAAVTGFAYAQDRNACLRETAYYCRPRHPDRYPWPLRPHPVRRAPARPHHSGLHRTGRASIGNRRLDTSLRRSGRLSGVHTARECTCYSHFPCSWGRTRRVR